MGEMPYEQILGMNEDNMWRADTWRIQFLEDTILLLLMHPSLYERLQGDVAEQVTMSSGRIDKILEFLRDDKFFYAGSDFTQKEDLVAINEALKKKIAHYKAYGNFDG